MQKIDISVVVPLYNEEESLPELVEWIHRVMIEHGFVYELIMVDDGSNDHSWQVITRLKSLFPAIKGIKFQRNYGKSAALHTGFQHAKGEVIITMDADLQDSPDEIPELYRLIKEEKFDLVSGYKKKRYDPLSKTIHTKLFNWATRKISGIHNLHDFNCGLKAYRKDVVKAIEVYGELHRYIPFLAKEAGFKKIGEKVVVHRPRKYGTTKFGLERFINGFLDLLTLSFTLKFGRAPMHFFGSFGVLSFLTGFFIVVYLIAQKLYGLHIGEKPREVVDQPLFYLALAALIIGVQLFLAGFLGELLIRNSPNKNQYLISEMVE
jgi:glycosyltransferase involved in cell wall biosynthesis